ncbi:MAG: type II toxin-antitoxin system HicB family antitoxin, partial [Sandaracinobacter sp.]
MRFTYPVRPEEQPDGSFVMHLRDFGGATQGATRIEAYRAAKDYIATWIQMKIEFGQDIPEPAACAVGEMLIEAPIDVAVVGLLHQGMLEPRCALAPRTALGYTLPMLPHQTDAWATLERLATQAQTPITQRFEDEPTRIEAHAPTGHGIRLDL